MSVNMGFWHNFHNSNRSYNDSRNFTRMEGNREGTEFRRNENIKRDTPTPVNVPHGRGNAEWERTWKNSHTERKEWPVHPRRREGNWEDERRHWNIARREMVRRRRRQEREREKEKARIERTKALLTPQPTMPVFPVFHVEPNVTPRVDPRNQCSKELQHLIDLSLSGRYRPYGFNQMWEMMHAETSPPPPPPTR